MRIAPAIALTNEEHRKLLALSRARRQPMRLGQGAKIVLLAAKGLENREIAQRLGVGMTWFRGGGVAISPRV
jgi:hypothetical protein